MTSHVDKLMNYIRYWQASGESPKTSIRVKTRLSQIVQEGKFRGGTPPYGYRLVKRGRTGRKNKELYDIEINAEEAEDIREIFDLTDRFGYGGRRISSELKAKGILNRRTGEPFHFASIQNFLKNVMYTGVLRSGETFSDVFPELQIISVEQFERVTDGVKQRSVSYAKKCEAAVLRLQGELGTENYPLRTYPLRNSGKALLSGNIYCGHCGGRMFATTARKSHHLTPGRDNVRVPIYKCYNRTQHKELCDGATSYRAERVDQVIHQLVMDLFRKAKSIRERDLIGQELGRSTANQQQQLRKYRQELAKRKQEKEKWENLMLDSLEGTCVFTPEQVKRRLDAVEAAIDTLSEQLAEIQRRLSEQEKQAAALKAEHQQMLSWAKLYESCSQPEKKIIVSHLIGAVILRRGYELEVRFNLSEAQFLNWLDLK